MKLSHAIKVTRKLLETADRHLSPEDAAALTVLVEMAQRVTRGRGAVRDVARALYGEELNQADLFGEEPP